MADSTSGSGRDRLRLPDSHKGMQVNACRNSKCPNFGVGASAKTPRGKNANGYVLAKSSDIAPDRRLRCKLCGHTSSIKSNEAIAKEMARLSAYLEPRPAPDPGCGTQGCGNAAFGVRSHPDRYASKGRRRGAQRYRCKACGRVFSVPVSSTHRQKKPHINRGLFAEIVSKKPIRGTAFVFGVNPATVYEKLDFLYEQCRGFAGEREAQLHRKELGRIKLCVDRQDYIVNWRSRNVRKNIQLSAICTVEGRSGYVLGHHLNYDPNINQVDVEDAARMNGDLDPGRPSYFKANPQYWPGDEFQRLAGLADTEIPLNLERGFPVVEDLIEAKNIVEGRRPEPERADMPGFENQLPPDGVMTRVDYTAFAHARLIERFVRGASRVRVYLDQDAMLRLAYLSAFSPRIALGEVEMAYVQFTKMQDRDFREQCKRTSDSFVKDLVRQGYGSTEAEAIRGWFWCEYGIKRRDVLDWKERWITHPRSTLGEPEKKVLYLTDRSEITQKALDRASWTLAQATLAPVDSYFMRLRRKNYYIERPLQTRSNGERVWNGYHAYDPKRIMQLLEIYRVYSNYVRVPDTKDGKTPAMELGLARGPVSLEDIIYF